MATKETKLQIVVDAQNRTQGTFNALKDNLDAVKKSHQGLSSAMQGVGLASSVAFGGLALLSKEIVQAGAGFEQTQIAFTTMLGSAELAKKTLAELADFAARTPFELPQLENTSKQLLAYGTTAEELLPTLKMLGDISAGVGMDKLPQLTLAFGQVRAATKLTGAELRQFSEAGVPLLGALASQLGKTESEIIDMVSEGKIGFQDMRNALAGMTGEGGKFFNLMDQQASSLNGRISSLNDAITLTQRIIGEELLPYLQPLVEKLTAVVQGIGEWVKANPQLAAAILAISIGLAAVLAVLLPIAIALPGIIIMLGALGTAFAVVTAISAPLLLAIGAIIAVLAIFVSQGYLTKEAWQNVWLGIKLIATDAANAVVKTVEAMVNFILSGVNKAIQAINKVIALAQKVPGIGKNIKSISEVKADFGTFNTTTVAANDVAGRSNPVSFGSKVVNLIGGNYLSETVAEQIGNLIMGGLKRSNQL